MSDNLREAYKNISSDYLLKKSKPWNDFVEYTGRAGVDSSEITIDIGAGNGRNLNSTDSNLPIAFDLSYELLQGYIGPEHGIRIVGALPKLPFRNNISDNIIMIAVLHHLETDDLRKKSMVEVKRVLSSGKIILSVWRKWRKGVREGIFERIRDKKNTHDLYNVQRPWKSSTGKLIATRFYHYFTMKDLRDVMNFAELMITDHLIAGGRHRDANIFVTLKNKN